MRLCFTVFANKFTGYGHHYRSLALARTAQQRGHEVFVASDRQSPDGLYHIPTKYNDPASLALALEVAKPDWLIVDVPDPFPAWIREMAKCKVAALNGIGYNQTEGLDLRVIQGHKDVELPGKQDGVPTVKGIEYVILRPEIQKYKGAARTEDWLCWGGGTDPLGLLPRFTVACPGWFAVLIASPMIPVPIVTSPTHAVVRMNEGCTDIFGWMASSKASCVSFGMVVYELLYLNTLIYAFASTPLHLRFAQPLAKQGLIKLWPKVGLPSKEEVRAFLEQDFEVPQETGIDLNGATRVMEKIEDFS